MCNLFWKTIDGMPGYEFGYDGTVKSLPKKGNGYKTIITKGHERKTGYFVFTICINGKEKQEKVHRLIAKAHIPNPHNLPEVNHLDAIKSNNAVSNLEWTTNPDNRKHAAINGLMPMGERVGTAKLTNKQALEIFESKLSVAELSEIYSVGRCIIGNIKNGRTWGHLTGKKFVKQERIADEIVLSIYHSIKRNVDISKEFGINFRVVSKIKKGEIYSNVTKHKWQTKHAGI